MIQKGDIGNRGKKKKRFNFKGLYFLGSVAFFYFLLVFFYPENIQASLKASATIFTQICPALFMIIVLMGIMNYFVNPKTVSKYVGEGSGIRGWVLALSTGILSHGPIYAWYPLLRDLRDQGMKTGLVVVFLYARAIKIPLLPLMVYYFGTAFVAILTGYMIIAALVQGYIFQSIEGALSTGE